MCQNLFSGRVQRSKELSVLEDFVDNQCFNQKQRLKTFVINIYMYRYIHLPSVVEWYLHIIGFSKQSFLQRKSFSVYSRSGILNLFSGYSSIKGKSIRFQCLVTYLYVCNALCPFFSIHSAFLVFVCNIYTANKNLR